MKILLDENLPRKLKDLIPEHDVHTVVEMKWAGTKNGELLTLLYTNGFDVLITADKIDFYYYSRGSVTETQNHVEYAKRVGYVATDAAENGYSSG